MRLYSTLQIKFTTCSIVSVIPALKNFTHDDYPARSPQKQYSCYTRSIDAETLLAFRDSIRLAPVFIQKRIQKKA